MPDNIRRNEQSLLCMNAEEIDVERDPHGMRGNAKKETGNAVGRCRWR